MRIWACCLSPRYSIHISRLNENRTDWISAQTVCNKVKRTRTSEINYYGWWDVGKGVLRRRNEAVVFIMEVSIIRRTTEGATGQIEYEDHANCFLWLSSFGAICVRSSGQPVYGVTVQSKPSWCKHRVPIYMICHSIFSKMFGCRRFQWLSCNIIILM